MLFRFVNLITAIFVIYSVISFSSTSFANTSPQYLLGWRTDAAIVYEPNRGFNWENQYSEFENGQCGLTAHAERNKGTTSVIITYNNSRNTIQPCTKAGTVFGVYGNCNYSSEDKTFANGARCSRDLDAATVEYVSASNIQNILSLQRRDKISHTDTFWNFNYDFKTIPVNL